MVVKLRVNPKPAFFLHSYLLRRFHLHSLTGVGAKEVYGD